jgi:hypothetical protein
VDWGEFIEGHMKLKGQQLKRAKEMAMAVGRMALMALAALVILISGIVIIVSLYNLFKTFEKGFSRAWASLAPVIEYGINMIETGISFISSGVTDVIDGIMNGDWGLVFSGVIDILGGLLVTIGGGLLVIFGGIIAGIWTIASGLFQEIWHSGANWAEKIFTMLAIVVVIAAAIALIVFVVTAAPVWLAAIATAAIVALGAAMIKGIRGWIPGLASGGIANGLTLVGEKGPELVNLPAGSKVHSNSDSRKMVGGSSVTNNITVNVKGSMGSSDSEIRVLADKIGKMIGKEINRTTNTARF